MKSAIATGPISVAVDATSNLFKTYSSGIITNASECGTLCSHAVNVVGYGTDSLLGDFYIVRNSWGTGWGESGYARIGTGSSLQADKGVCGINQYPAYPVVAY